MKELIRRIACGVCEVLSETLQPAGTIGINEMSSILLDKLEEMGDDHAELYLPDSKCKIYKKDDVIKFLHLDETNKITYVKETMDCDDFAAELYGKGMSLIWSNVHALNFFISEDKELWFVEPQNDKVSKALENWQGFEIRFFLGR